MRRRRKGNVVLAPSLTSHSVLESGSAIDHHHELVVQQYSEQGVFFFFFNRIQCLLTCCCFAIIITVLCLILPVFRLSPVLARSHRPATFLALPSCQTSSRRLCESCRGTPAGRALHLCVAVGEVSTPDH